MDTATLASARTRAADYLLRGRNADGSWGYLPGQKGAGEPTLLAAAAGLPAPLAWLDTAELDYAWLLLPAALAGVQGAEELVSATLDRIVSTQGFMVEVPEDVIGNDFMIPAWPWVDGTAPWVEPTSYAVISLRKAGKADHPRTADGLRMLRDRQCADGGWNYGNSKVYGVELESEIAPTCWAVMAMPAGSPEVERAWKRVGEARELRSSLTLSLSTLALTAHGRDPGDLVELLVAHQREDGSFSGRNDWTALGLAALRAVEEGVHAFVARS
jgi:hypothetical protein